MKYKVSLLTLFLIFTISVFGESFDKEKTITRSFKVNPDAEMQINNKYGNIQVMNWDKDSIKIEIKISVTGNRLSKVNKTFNYIDIDFTENQYYLIANTIFKNETNNFWTDVSDITNSIFKGGSNTQINYTVYMPEENPLKIKNKFGNIYLGNRKTLTEIELSNGDFKAHEINGYFQFDFSYGSASIRSLADAQIDINYGDIRLKKIDKITIDSRSSTIDCDYIDELNISSKRDKYYLGDVNRVSGNAAFTEFQFDYLTERLNLETNFGELSIDLIDPNFNRFIVNSSNTDIYLNFENNSPHNLELSYTRRTSVSLTSDYDISSQKPSEEDDEITIIKATASNAKETDPKVVIKQKSGSVSLMSK